MFRKAFEKILGGDWKKLSTIEDGVEIVVSSRLWIKFKIFNFLFSFERVLVSKQQHRD